MTINPYDFKSPVRATEWYAYNKIRRVVLFESRGRFGVYEDDHPDERAEGNHPFLLMLDNEPIGTVRVDCLPDDLAVLRLVAIALEHQGRGHGRQLLTMAEDFARSQGARHILVNAAIEAVDFYSRAGYRRQDWNDPYGAVEDSVQLAKDL